MATLQALVRYIDDLLGVDAYQDYCPNGLQIEGRTEVNTLVSGVTASLALLEAALEVGADAVLVHHGYFWRGEDPRVIGLKHRRLKVLLQADISLLAYHLPLDAHPRYGNNAQLADLLGLVVDGGFGGGGRGPDIGLYGRLAEPMRPQALTSYLTERLDRIPLHVSGGPEMVERIAWCTGAAQGYIEQAAALGVDAYLTGEVSEQTVHIARESGIHFYAAGHHATERYGVQALGAHLADYFSLDHRFIEIDNPV